MNFFKKPLIALACTMLALPFSGMAQYRFEVDPLLSYFKEAKRYELGFNYVMPFGEFAGTVPVYNNSGTFMGDTTTKRNITAISGIGGDIGLSLPFKRTGHTSCWAVSLHAMGNMIVWSDLNATQKLDGTLIPKSKPLNANTLQISLPIGIDWMAGNHAILTKRLPLGIGLGAGAMPQMTMTSLDGVTGFDSKMSFGVTPYAKAELSIFAGLDIKLRMMYTMGHINMIEIDKAIPGDTDGPFKVNSTSNFILSLIIMPFSGGWHESAWYNTYDTYNQHDRLN